MTQRQHEPRRTPVSFPVRQLVRPIVRLPTQTRADGSNAPANTSYLLDEAGNILTDESGNRLTWS